MQWVCRTDNVIFRDHRWDAGDLLETHEPEGAKWTYSGGFWHLEGMEVYNPSDNNVIPRHFDPLDFLKLVDSQAVIDAREKNSVPAKFRYPNQPAPEPLTPETVEPINPESIKKKRPKPVSLTGEQVRRGKII